MKLFKTYKEFINESVLPYELVQYDFSNKKWSEDKEGVKSFEEKNPTYDNVRVFVSDEKSRNLKYIFTSWKDTNYRVIQLQENGNIIFVYKYIDDEKRDFKQDYQEILGQQYK
jgi:hypothetical protein